MHAATDTDGLSAFDPWTVIIILAELTVFGWIMTKAIITTARMPAPAMVTTALAVLTLISIGGLIITRDQVLGAVAATGVGAMAGAMTNLFGISRKNRDRDDSDDTS